MSPATLHRPYKRGLISKPRVSRKALPRTLTSRQSRERQYIELMALEYEKCYREYYAYFKRAWQVLEPATPLLPGWHHEAIAEHLTACYNRQIKRLIVNIPPRYSKSTLVTVTWPGWVWLHNPAERFMFTSYSAGLSTKHSIDRRTIIESEWYQSGWGCRCKGPTHDAACKGFRMSSDQNVKTEFENDRRGHMLATSMGGTATGKGGNILIVDDPHDITRADSQSKRTADVHEFDQKFTTRLDDKTNGVIIVVMQRLHPDDLTGHLLAQGGYEHLCLPAEAPTRTVVRFPISGKEIVREQGDVLHPAREDKTALDNGPRKVMGTHGYNAQYQQEPKPLEGSILKRAWWKRYASLPTRAIQENGKEVHVKDFDEIVDFWDMNFKNLDTADTVVGGVFLRKGADVYILHMNYKPKGFIESKNAVKKNREIFPEIRKTVIEDKANGPAIIEALKSEVPGLVAFNPQGSKEERASAVTPQLEAGNVYLPEKDIATFDVESYITNLADFPNVAQDGDVDVTTMALLYFAKPKNKARVTMI